MIYFLWKKFILKIVLSATGRAGQFDPKLLWTFEVAVSIPAYFGVFIFKKYVHCAR